jgi:hypothetical protein
VHSHHHWQYYCDTQIFHFLITICLPIVLAHPLDLDVRLCRQQIDQLPVLLHEVWQAPGIEYNCRSGPVAMLGYGMPWKQILHAGVTLYSFSVKHAQG